MTMTRARLRLTPTWSVVTSAAVAVKRQLFNSQETGGWEVDFRIDLGLGR